MGGSISKKKVTAPKEWQMVFTSPCICMHTCMYAPKCVVDVCRPEFYIRGCWELLLMLYFRLRKATLSDLRFPAPSCLQLIIKNCCTAIGWAGKRGRTFRLHGQGTKRWEGERESLRQGSKKAKLKGPPARKVALGAISLIGSG